MGNTIGYLLISYDVNRLHTDVKVNMEKMGYSNSFNYERETKTYYLPNTTLWHAKKSSDQAINDIKTVCRSLGVNLEKAVAVLASEFVAI